MEAVETRRKQGRISISEKSVYDAKQQTQSDYFRDTNTNNDRSKIFEMAWTIKYANKDVTREKYVRDDKGNLTISDEAKLHVWKEHYQRLLNIEFPWHKNSLNNSQQLKDLLYSLQRIRWHAIKKMKKEKVGGPSGVIVEMIKVFGRETVTAISELVNHIIYEENSLEDWKDSFIINCYYKKKVMQQIVGTLGALSS